MERCGKLTKPVRVLDCGCGYGFLGSPLLPLLPEGSTYTGVDFDETLIREGEAMLCDTDFDVSLYCARILWNGCRKKHPNVAMIRFSVKRCSAISTEREAFLERMVSFTRPEGLPLALR